MVKKFFAIITVLVSLAGAALAQQPNPKEMGNREENPSGTKAAVAPILLSGKELRDLVVTEKGTTWTLNNSAKTRITFMPDGNAYACEVRSSGEQVCDSGTYLVAEVSVQTSWHQWYSATAGKREVVISKKGEGLLLNDREVLSRTDVATLAPPSAEVVAAKIAAKRALAQSYLSKDVIKMTAHIKDHGGIHITLDVRAYPLESKMQVFGSGSYCELSKLDASFSVTDRGDIKIARSPRMNGCAYLEIEIDPLAQKISVFAGQPRIPGLVNRSWTLDN